jgi:hypothetical protein
LAPFTETERSAGRDRTPKRVQRPLRMIPRGQGLVHRRGPVCVQTGQKNCGFDLGAGAPREKTQSAGWRRCLESRAAVGRLRTDRAPMRSSGTMTRRIGTPLQRIVAGSWSWQRGAPEESGEHSAWWCRNCPHRARRWGLTGRPGHARLIAVAGRWHRVRFLRW